MLKVEPSYTVCATCLQPGGVAITNQDVATAPNPTSPTHSPQPGPKSCLRLRRAIATASAARANAKTLITTIALALTTTTITTTIGCYGVRLPPLAAPVEPQRPRATEAPVKIVTFNLYNRPWTRRARLQGAAEVLGPLEPDIVGLQEVARWFWERDQATEQLSAHLGLEAYHFWLEEAFPFDNGLGILSRFPIRLAGGHRFHTNRAFNTKGFVYAVVETPKGLLGVVNVHLGAVVGGPIKKDQFAELEAVVRALSRRMPIVLLGDFNESLSTTVFSAFVSQTQAQFGRLSGTTAAGGYGLACANPRGKQLDYIFYVPHAAAEAPTSSTTVSAPGQRLVPAAVPTATPTTATTHASISPLHPNDPWRLTAGVVIPTQAPYPSDHCPVLAHLEAQR